MTLILVNTMNLESFSTAGSVGFILVFSIINYIGFSLSDAINGVKIIPLTGLILGLIALMVLIAQQFSSNLPGVILAISFILVSFLIEYIYKKSSR